MSARKCECQHCFLLTAYFLLCHILLCPWQSVGSRALYSASAYNTAEKTTVSDVSALTFIEGV